MDTLLGLVPVLLLGTGFFYLFRLRGFYLLHPIRCLGTLRTAGAGKGISPMRALSVALAGTLGVGNIVGVAAALYFGGTGAVLWMVIGALVAMVLKYAEVTLALRHRKVKAATSPQKATSVPSGGAFDYMEDCLAAHHRRRAGRMVGGLFAILCLLNAVTMGGILQVNAVAGAMEAGFDLPPLVTGIALAVLCFLVSRGGARRIAALTGKLVPIMTAGFLILCLLVILLRRERVGEALVAVWQDAWSWESAAAGGGGFLFSRAIHYGIMRGLVSNEAGCGTAPMAHVTAENDRPAAQGVFGLVEVFVDTVLLCTVTALAILVSDSGPDAFGADSVRTARAAFSSVLGEGAGTFFSLSILCFGAATVLCWAHYGRSALAYLTGGRGEGMFLFLFSVSLVPGALFAPGLAWSLADGALGVMTIINLAFLCMMHREVEEETGKVFGHK